MSTITTTIDPFTKTPSRQNPATFSSDMDTRLSEENSRIVQMNKVSSEMNTVAGEVNTNANTATTQANLATAQANLALSSANYKGNWDSDYNSGNGYDQSDSVSFTDGQIYISKSNGNTTSPTSGQDTAYWYLLKTLANFIDDGSISETPQATEDYGTI